MSWKTDIRYAVKELVGANNPDSPVLTGVVESVDKPNRECSVMVLSGETEIIIDNVRLQIVTDNGFILYPKKGSTVVISNEVKAQPFVLMYSEIDTVLAVQSLWQFNKGDNGGVPKVIELTEKINRLENKFNDFAAAFVTHTHATAPTGPVSPPTIVPPATAPTSITPLTTRSDIEDTKITH